MTPSARENYLSTETLTAAPQKLQLLLVEAAIRSARRGGQLGTPARTTPSSRCCTPKPSWPNCSAA